MNCTVKYQENKLRKLKEIDRGIKDVECQHISQFHFEHFYIDVKKIFKQKQGESLILTLSPGFFVLD